MSRTAAAVSLLVSVAAAGDWPDRVGKEPPGGATTWLRACEATTYEALLGRVVVIVHWSPAREGVRDDLFLIQELHERIHRRGGRVLALTEAAADAVNALLAEEDLFCAVGVETKPGEGAAFGSELPYAYLVGPDGAVLWQGRFVDLPSKALEAALKKAKPFTLPALHDAHEKTVKLYGKGKLFEAACDAMFTAEFAKDYWRGNERRIRLVTEDAGYIRDRVEGYRAYWWKLVEEGRARGDFDQVAYALEEIRLHFGGEHFKSADYGIKAGDDKVAAAQKDALRKEPAAERAAKAARSLVALVAKQESTRLTEETRAQLLRRFEEFQREWEGTYAARRAARRAKWLEGQPAEPAKGGGGEPAK